MTRENVESTKLQIVYDASARERDNQPFLNDSLNPGSPLQNRPLETPNSSNTSVLRFTRALFGMTCSHFLLGGVINQPLDTWESQYPELIKEIRDGLYVDDLITGGENAEITAERKAITTEVFKDASFTIHKWHSNVPDLQAISSSLCEEELTYAKQQLGGAKPSEGKLLGVPWDREQDVISVILQITQTENYQERRAAPSCEDLRPSWSCITSNAHRETALS